MDDCLAEWCASSSILNQSHSLSIIVLRGEKRFSYAFIYVYFFFSLCLYSSYNCVSKLLSFFGEKCQFAAFLNVYLPVGMVIQEYTQFYSKLNPFYGSLLHQLLLEHRKAWPYFLFLFTRHPSQVCIFPTQTISYPFRVIAVFALQRG